MPYSFYRRNLLETTTAVFASAGATGSAASLFDRDIEWRWVTTGYTGVTSLALSINFATATVISALMLQAHNFTQFRAFYDSLTANVFTANVNVTGNSSAFSYFSFNSQTVNSVQIQVDSAFTATVAGSATTERVLGELIVTRQLFSSGASPAAGNYRPVIARTLVRQELADGGVALYDLGQKYQADIGYSFIGDNFYSDLSAVFNDAVPVVVVPFPASASWDGDAFEVEWVGANDFKWAGNDKNAQGWNGNIRLEQTYGGAGRRP